MLVTGWRLPDPDYFLFLEIAWSHVISLLVRSGGTEERR